jgi:hypothetical protein
MHILMFDIMIVNGISQGFRRSGIDFAPRFDQIVIMGGFVLKVKIVLRFFK